MNGKPNVEPAWMSLKRLVETRMIEILRKEQDNKRYSGYTERKTIGMLSKSRPSSWSGSSGKEKPPCSDIRTILFRW